jgi:hypothetical protein
MPQKRWIEGGWGARLPSASDRRSLREWWHSILRNAGRFSCYAIFLVLPSDKEAIRYLSYFGKELDILSGENCLIIALSDTEARCPGVREELWQVAIAEYASRGASAEVARRFSIEFDRFPCLVVFEDIRSPKHTLITLKGMAAEEIAERMRVIFSAIEAAISENTDPVAAIQSLRNNELFVEKGKSIVSELRSIAGKTLEAAMEAWIKAGIK